MGTVEEKKHIIEIRSWLQTDHGVFCILSWRKDSAPISAQLDKLCGKYTLWYFHNILDTIQTDNFMTVHIVVCQSIRLSRFRGIYGNWLGNF